MKCYSSEHLLWCGLFGVPMILLWSVGIPLAAFLILYKNRHNLDSPKVKRYYLMVYQGLKNDRFFWEFVNTIRKVSIMGVNVFLSRESLVYRIITLTIVLILFYRLQVKLEPYKNKENNSLERIEIVAGALTLYGGILFVHEQTRVGFLESTIFILIMGVNIYFIMYWIYCMLVTFRYTHQSINSALYLLSLILRVKYENPTQPQEIQKKTLLKNSSKNLKGSFSRSKKSRTKKSSKSPFVEEEDKIKRSRKSQKSNTNNDQLNNNPSDQESDVHSQNGIKKERKTIIHKIGKKRSVKFGQLKRNNEIDSDADNLSKNTRKLFGIKSKKYNKIKEKKASKRIPKEAPKDKMNITDMWEVDLSEYNNLPSSEAPMHSRSMHADSEIDANLDNISRKILKNAQVDESQIYEDDSQYENLSEQFYENLNKTNGFRKEIDQASSVHDIYQRNDDKSAAEDVAEDISLHQMNYSNSLRIGSPQNKNVAKEGTFKSSKKLIAKIENLNI